MMSYSLRARPSKDITLGRKARQKDGEGDAVKEIGLKDPDIQHSRGARSEPVIGSTAAITLTYYFNA